MAKAVSIIGGKRYPLTAGLLAPGLLARALASDTGAGRLARRILPAVVLVPPALGGLCLLGAEAGWYDVRLGLALFAVATMLVLAAAVLGPVTYAYRAEVEQVWARAVLIENDRRLRALLGSSILAIAVTDAEDRIVAVNAAFARLVGCDERELVARGVRLSDFVAPEYAPTGRAEVERLIGGDETTPWEMELVRKDGGRVPVLAARTFSDDGGTERVALFFDVTDRRRALEAVFESEERYRRIVETANEGIWLTDAAMRTVFVNRKMAEMLGYDVRQMLGRSLLEFVPAERHEAVAARDARARQGASEQFDLRFRRRDGSALEAIVAASPLFDRAGTYAGSLLMILDVTERVWLEELKKRSEALEEQNRRAVEASRLKSAFVANLSHELRTPLNAILGFTELLHDEKVGPLTPRQKEYLSDVLTSGQHLLTLINDVLDLAKIEAGRIELRPEPIDLARHCTEVHHIVRELAGRRRVMIETEIEPGLGTVTLDPARLKQVLYNYLSNAIKFSHEGGRVFLRVRDDGDARLRLEVEDEGIGIAPEDLPRLFVEFQRLDTAGPPQPPGTGLGLAIVHRIVSVLGGEVGVASAPGRGSCFFATLPRTAGPTGVRDGGRRPASPILLPSREAPLVLVLNNELRDAAWAARTLLNGGLGAQLASSIEEAEARLSERRYAAVVADGAVLGDGRGDAVARLRAGPNAATPVVALVAARRETLPGGLAAAVEKPVEPAELLAAVSLAMSRSRREAVA